MSFLSDMLRNVGGALHDFWHITGDTFSDAGEGWRGLYHGAVRPLWDTNLGDFGQFQNSEGQPYSWASNIYPGRMMLAAGLAGSLNSNFGGNWGGQAVRGIGSLANAIQNAGAPSGLETVGTPPSYRPGVLPPEESAPAAQPNPGLLAFLLNQGRQNPMQDEQQALPFFTRRGGLT